MVKKVQNRYDVIIIGAGPAGLMAAIEASKKYKILLIEKNPTPGKKLLITGGGRCNVTNLKPNNSFLNEIDYHKKYLYSTIYAFGPQQIYDFFTKNNVPLKEEKENQIFPVSDKASDILACLTRNIQNATYIYGEEVLAVQINNTYKEVITMQNKYQAKNIIIATGGSSFKQTGSTGDHIKFAKTMNQPTVPLFPAETSVLLDEKNDLAGTSFENVSVKYGKINKQGNLMFTHKGLGGTAIMKMSEHIYLHKEKEIAIDFIPDMNREQLQQMFIEMDREKQVVTCLHQIFTKRFSIYLIHKVGLKEQDKMKNINTKQLNQIIEQIKNTSFTVRVNVLETAYVTGGGIDLDYMDTKTMESKLHRGVYYVGEALDIHGPTGGYNITLALSTGYTAGTHITL